MNNTMLVKTMCLAVLSCLANPLFSQTAGTNAAGSNIHVNGIEADSLGRTKDGLHEVSSAGIQPRACVSSYTNQTVSSTVTVYGCSTLSVQRVTVTGTGNLSLVAPENILIDGPFVVNGGGTLNVTYGQQIPRVIHFGYDASGNRSSLQSNL